jgi:hypothetical protein
LTGQASIFGLSAVLHRPQAAVCFQLCVWFQPPTDFVFLNLLKMLAGESRYRS